MSVQDHIQKIVEGKDPRDAAVLLLEARNIRTKKGNIPEKFKIGRVVFNYDADDEAWFDSRENGIYLYNGRTWTGPARWSGKSVFIDGIGRVNAKRSNIADLAASLRAVPGFEAIQQATHDEQTFTKLEPAVGTAGKAPTGTKGKPNPKPKAAPPPNKYAVFGMNPEDITEESLTERFKLGGEFEAFVLAAAEKAEEVMTEIVADLKLNGNSERVRKAASAYTSVHDFDNLSPLSHKVLANPVKKHPLFGVWNGLRNAERLSDIIGSVLQNEDMDTLTALGMDQTFSNLSWLRKGLQTDGSGDSHYAVVLPRAWASRSKLAIPDKRNRVEWTTLGSRRYGVMNDGESLKIFIHPT